MGMMLSKHETWDRGQTYKITSILPRSSPLKGTREADVTTGEKEPKRREPHKSSQLQSNTRGWICHECVCCEKERSQS